MAGGGPGAGNYNPHDEVRKMRLNKTDYKFWIGKHKTLDKTLNDRDSRKPSPASYSPKSMTMRTFDTMPVSPKKKKESQFGFGTDARFEYIRPNKKTIVEKRPAPVSYRTTYDWKGKGDKPKQRTWDEDVWKGRVEGVYH